MPPLPPAPHKGRRGTVINDTSRPLEPTVSRARFALRRGGFVSSSRVTVLSVLPDVSAEHTFEVIPKSMILPIFVWSFSPTERSLALKTVATKYLQHKMFNFDIERQFSNIFPLMHTSNLWAYCLRILKHEGVVLLSFECLYAARKASMQIRYGDFPCLPPQCTTGFLPSFLHATADSRPSRNSTVSIIYHYFSTELLMSSVWHRELWALWRNMDLVAFSVQ